MGYKVTIYFGGAVDSIDAEFPNFSEANTYARNLAFTTESFRMIVIYNNEDGEAVKVIRPEEK